MKKIRQVPLGGAIFVATMLFLLQGLVAGNEDQDSPKWAIVIHGGAGSTPKDSDSPRTRAKRAALKQALDAGVELLEKGGSSLDAVEVVIRILEDNPFFNAGKGAVKNARGQHELDASIMDGKDLSCGAVAGVTTVKNPISLARKVMTETRHVLLQGEGAEAFADQQAVDRVDNQDFSVSRFDSRKSPNSLPPQGDRSYKGTVGCVALDQQGHLAAGTSTGGLSGKKFGRVGDSPIIGAGTYANDATCGVSCTGTGEEYIRHAAAFTVSALMEFKGLPVDRAVSQVMRQRLKPGDGGMIAISKRGEICADYTTGGMAYALADSQGRSEVHWGDVESGLK
ncbi:MAG: isoaspartyl peptidase/L-asparaginase [Planctomycetota bacterium]|nr:isoaspartyl peptidase/L-asparaginase [Planctomycetota bacterium]